MESLKNHVLVYDSECPMCDLYTKGFIRAGMLDNDGRVAYGCAKVPASFSNDRARDEIALIDYENGTVTYGLDSLFKVLGHSFPFLQPVFRCAAVRYPLQILYHFISYNRKVIAPPNEFEKRGSCTPAYNTGYRVAYIVFAWLLTSLILTAFVPLLSPIVPASSFGREFLICGGQIVFQGIFIGFMSRGKLMHYLGNMMTVSLIGALLLVPMLLISRLFLIANPLFFLAWFVLVVTFMLLLHWKRVTMLGISWRATASWLGSILILFILLHNV
jgi:hypothetical protein